MLIHLKAVLDAESLQWCRQALAGANWQDGRYSAGYLSASVKRNAQLADNDPVARQVGARILQALDAHPRFTSAALPAKVLPPLFNRYAGDQHYGEHVDGAIRPYGDSGLRVRTDLSATLFLSDPEAYEGGELFIEDTFGTRSIKLSAGDMVLYPGTSVHGVRPVTRGERLASFFWIQSMIRNDGQRQILHDLDDCIQSLASSEADPAALVRLAGVYHNLLRQWAEL